MRRRALVVTIAAIAACVTSHQRHTDNAQRGGAWTLHEPHDLEPCASNSGIKSCRFDEPAVSTAALNPFFRAFRRYEDTLVMALDATPHAVMSVSSTCINHLDKLSVSFQLQHTQATDNDWIGAYCVDDEAASLPDHEYIDWRWTRGRSVDSIQFGPLTNMRCVWQFRFFSGSGSGPGSFRKLGETEFVRFDGGPTEPQQVHLAMTDDPEEMRVLWTSASVKNAALWVGLTPNLLDKTANASVRTYQASDMCGSPATRVAAQFFRDPGMLYDAVVGGLQPNTVYYYRVGSLTDGQSPVYSFKTPPAVGTQPHAMSFFVFGDLGDWNIKATGPKPENRTQTTVELMVQDWEDPARDYLAVFHVGDLAYAMGRTYLWDQFASLIEPIATVLPYMVGIGNHEYDYLTGGENDPSGAPGNGFHPEEGNFGGDSQGECGVPYNKRYIMPANGNQAFWWSVDLALAHHVMLSSEHDFRPGSPMYEWLVKDLAKVDRAKTPWLILHTHRPMYCSVQYPADYKLSKVIRRHLEPLLALYHVDLVFSGHYHSYERTCAVYNGSCRSDWSVETQFQPVEAPVHIMVGAAGANVDNAPYYDVPWRVAALMDYGYGRVHIHNATHAQFEFKRNRENVIADATWVVSHHNWTVVD